MTHSTIRPNNLFRLTAILTAIYLVTPAEKLSAEPQPQTTTVADSKNQIVKLTDAGIEPETVSMKRDDVLLFLLNDSTDSLATVEIEFGKNTMHCGGGNLTVDGTKIRSVRPFGPRDFATVCFHDPGTYDLRVYGLRNSPKGIQSKPEGIQSKIVVE